MITLSYIIVKGPDCDCSYPLPSERFREQSYSLTLLHIIRTKALYLVENFLVENYANFDLCHLSAWTATYPDTVNCTIHVHVPPAEDTLVSTGKAGRSLHTAMTLYAIKGVLVTPSTATKHALSPPTHLYTRMRANNTVACEVHMYCDCII